MIESTDHGSIRELRLNRPPANAFSPDLVAAMTNQLEEVTSAEVDAVVISGAPGMFTGGLDVPVLLTLDRNELRSFFQSFYLMLKTVATCDVPVAAAITGHSPAAGAVLVAFCDYRVISEGPFKIGMNEVQVGLTVPSILQYAMKRLVGPRRGDALLTAGALISPEEALEYGFVDQVVGPDDVVSNALAWAEGLAALPRDAMRNTRRIARADLVAQFDDLRAVHYEEMADHWFTEETQRTMQALVDKLAGR